MKKYFLALLLLGALCSYGQDSIVGKTHRIISAGLSAPFYNVPRFTVGYMQQLDARWWAGTVMGYSGGLHNSDYTGHGYSLFEVRPEIYFDLRPKAKLKHLASFELFYINHHDHFETGKYLDKSDGYWYEYDAADYKRTKTGFNLNYSVLYYLTPKLILWQKIGAGLKNRNVKYDNFVNNRLSETYNDNESHFDFFGMDNYKLKEGNYVGFNFNLELNLAYKF